MVKVLMGLAAAVVIAVGGFFGFEFYTQHRIAGEVEAAFAQIRAGGGKASHGKVSFDLRSRTVRIADIATESATQPPVSVKIAAVTAAGVSQPDAARFSADSIEATGLEVSVRHRWSDGGRVTYKAPQIVMKDYSRPRQHANAARFGLPRRGVSVRAGAVCQRLRVFNYGAHHCGYHQ